jgi:predicted esterase
MPTTLRYALTVLGLLLGLPLIFILLLIPRTPVSAVGAAYLLGSFLIVTGMLSALRWRRFSLASMLIGLTVVLVTVAARILVPPAGMQINLITLPGQSGPRLLNRILNEQDIVLFGAQVAPYLGAVSPAEEKSLDFTFSQAFRKMETQGVTPLSPFLTTYLNRQSPDEFDAVISEPQPGIQPRSGIIFLHGFGGNFTLQCWLIARAAERIDALTVCPSTGQAGAWWNARGQSILDETLRYLRQRGVERIYLAGLSNGAIGASRLAEGLKDELAGLVLISGADPGAAIGDLPVLVLHGKDDERIPVSLMEAYASAAGPTASYHLFESDHFLLLKKAEETQQVIAEWLIQQEINSEAQ